MEYNYTIDIATGLSAKSKTWKNKKILWSDFVDKIKEEHKTTETYKEFIIASKEEQLKIKDVGGYVGGYIRNGRRNPENVLHRQLLTLDIDFAYPEFWDDFVLQYDMAAILHATHKHCDSDPRYRLLVPLDREVTPDEYVAIARKLAGNIGIDLFDNTTFETNRLMFWPSNPKDVDYYCQVQDGPWLCADDILKSYVDWTDVSQWPTADKKHNDLKKDVSKQEDPNEKKGIVGAFCRTFGIEEAIAEFLPDIYIPTVDGRYTYTKGTTSAGLVVYDDKFAYSHHGTDPCSGKLNNAFDLVRLHKFHHLDADEEYTTQKPKSFQAMENLARTDVRVKKTIATEKLDKARFDFGEEEYEAADENFEEKNIEWITELEVDFKGNYLSTATNINIILANDTRLKEAFKRNDFDSKRYVFKSLPWRRIFEPEPIRDVDYSGVRNYIESIYGISGTLKIDDSLALEFEKKSFHPIKDYLKGLKWDGEARVDSLLIDYFGADDNVYSREAIRKMLVGAVARIFKPGCKYDLVLTLVGDQGTGKSTFIKMLGKQWYSDTFMTVHGKEALEQIQGVWLMEIAELAGLRKAETESIKHFISKQEDIFRPAYARTSETFKRQCVFFGTTNNKDFLRDPTGNRRFMPIDVHPLRVTKSVWKDLEADIDQIWAEAVAMFRAGEALFLSTDGEFVAKREQINHSETDERKGLIEAYLNRKLPKDWDKMDIYERRTYIESEISPTGTEIRDYVCSAEIWCECLNKEKENMSKYNTRELNDILRTIEGWDAGKSTRAFKLYGTQKFYVRNLT